MPASRTVMRLGEAEHALKRGDLPAALDAAERALELQREAADEDMATGNWFGRVGALLAGGGHWGLARAALGVGLAIKSRRLGKAHRRIAPELTLLSAAHERLGDYRTALGLAERDLAIRRLQSNGAPADLAASLNNFGLAALGLEDFEGAAAAFREALAIGERTGAAELWLASLRDNLALALAPLGDGAARRLHEQAFKVRRARLPKGHPDLGRSLLHIGLCLLADGAYDEAEAHFRSALQIFEGPPAEARPAGRTAAKPAARPPDVLGAAQCLEGMAVLSVRRQRLAPGREMLRQAADMLRDAFGPDHLLVLRYETELAFLALFTGDLGGAAALGRAALRRALILQQDSLKRDLYALLSHLAAARGRIGAAILFGKLAANAMRAQAGRHRPETPLRRLFAARPGDAFRHVAALLAKAGRIADAGSALAMLKEDELFDVLRRDAALDPRRSTVALSFAETGWQRMGGAIARLLAVLEEGRADVKANGAASADLEDQRADAAGAFERWIDSAERAGDDEDEPGAAHPGLGALGARTALLHILPGPKTLQLMLTTTETGVVREVALPAAALWRLVADFRAAIAARSGDVQALGEALYRHLIAPVAPTYQALGIKTLLIGADGPLRYLPFAALHDGANYLAETTATVLFTEAAPDAAGPRGQAPEIAAFGAAGGGFGEEASRLVRDGKGGLIPGRLWLEEEFGPPSVAQALDEYRLIHLACPVGLDGADPANSFITLGDGTDVMLRELCALPYFFRNVSLVALTGCETSAEGDGSEIEALGALLRWRGVESVVASLWRPPGGPPPGLLASFYRQIRDGKAPSLALSAAQRATLTGAAAHRHPYFWAPLIVMGGLE